MPKKPAPFTRPSIEVGNTGPKRFWQWVSPEKLDEGDTVADFGVVSRVVVHRRRQTNSKLDVDGFDSGVEPIESIEVFAKTRRDSNYYQSTDVVHAFTVPKE